MFGKVYIFDDSPSWRRVLGEMVETAGLTPKPYVPSESNSWIPCQEDLVTIHRDAALFIIDVRLPDEQEGIELLYEIRRLENEYALVPKTLSPVRLVNCRQQMTKGP